MINVNKSDFIRGPYKFFFFLIITYHICERKIINIFFFE